MNSPAVALSTDHESGHHAVFARALATFGHDSLRPGQAEIIADIFSGRPVVAVMPTGAGKSLCYQLPAVVLGEGGGVTLVVSPLIALMKDQVDTLRGRGVPAVALTSASTAEERSSILDGIRAGEFTLVYVAPERFRSPRFVEALRTLGGRLSFVAIDEAHCISEWGHDFRPEYRRLGDVVKELAPGRVAAFTATATPEVRADIAEQLGLEGVRVHVRGFDRPNLRYAVEPSGGAAAKSERLVELVRTRDSGVALVYAATRKNAERYAAELKSAGMRAHVYHAGLADSAREKAQDRFMAGKLDAIVATNAFGMGIDKGDIHLVVHADIPRSPEAYYQEAGRGGRDGRPARCVLLFNHADIRLQEFLIEASYPEAETLRGTWKALRDDPNLGFSGGQGLEARLRAVIPGNPTGAAVSSCVRILERHGLVRLQGEDGSVVATRPEPGAFPPLDVEALRRRAEVERRKLRTMVEYAYWPRCRRQFVLAYFGDAEWADSQRRCGACDTCDSAARGAVAPPLAPEHARSIRALLLLIGDLGGRFGRTRLAAVATGTDDDPRFLDLPARGCLRGSSQRAVLDLIRELEGAGLIEASRGEYPTISTTRRGDQAAIGNLALDGLGLGLGNSRLPRRSSKSGKTGGAVKKRRRAF